MIKEKITKLLGRLEEVEQILAKPDVFEDAENYRVLTQEHSYLSEIKTVFSSLEKARASLKENQELLSSELDEEMIALLKEEIEAVEASIPTLEKELETLLVPPDPDDDRGVILEVRAGTGGDEAALFVGDCVRMYQLYAAIKGWKVETLSCNPSEVGGFKEYIMAISGPKVKRFLQYEGGTHRVQRVPETETQGRVHTSAVTVAIMLEPDEKEEIKIDEKDLRIDTYRASGAGGQHVNTTDSAVRITHLPSGAVAYCQDERSQHKNKDKAMRLLTAKIVEEERRKEAEAEAETRSAQVGTGDRSGRIRTYNFPQNRLTDHRINLTLYNLDRVMQGELEEVTTTLVKHFYQEKLHG
ncbi:MAG: Peptide chain release factor RF1 [Chlamydiales bacterium]|nr:Peptide chain release factor RF1 [Chlamydiales bacterium]MCH9619106.1 Peptide chain release factor RF1 [Chlamydiales bacterium]MCH9622368.1 Peptide chain release factor RF1 [Chlamydiales bacterium]